ncbi:MAG: hypothetical protein R3B91_10245 [Planctomycetaceae bacterium]
MASDQRIALVEKLQVSAEDVAPKRTPIGNLRGLLKLEGVDPPDDAQVRQWLEEPPHAEVRSMSLA